MTSQKHVDALIKELAAIQAAKNLKAALIAMPLTLKQAQK